IRDLIQDNISAEISMIIHDNRNRDICHYNALTASEVAAIIVGNDHETPRQTSMTMIGQLYMVQPSESERYYLRTLLTHINSATGFNDLKTMNDYIYSNFKKACSYLAFCNHTSILPTDLNDASDISNVIEHEALTQLENIFLLSRKSLKDFSDMPIPPITSNITNNKETLNHLICEERSYNIIDLQTKLQHNQREFAKFLLQIEDGTYLIIADTENKITLPSDIVVTGGKLSDLINYIYPNFIQNSNNINYLTERAILTPKNNDVN
ncbi:28169_t:CDS:2, partial [Racocetra persica]